MGKGGANEGTLDGSRVRRQTAQLSVVDRSYSISGAVSGEEQRPTARRRMRTVQ